MEAPPPQIPVRATIKSKYKPISKLNGDDLPLLRRLKKPEISGRVSFYNTFARGLLNTKVSVWYRQHEQVMDNLRKEQLQVYKVMCRMQRERRRVQRDEHERIREEIRRIVMRMRKKNLLRRVVAKFRENVVRKKAEREARERGENTESTLQLYPEQMMKYVGGFKRLAGISDAGHDGVKLTTGDTHGSVPGENRVAVEQAKETENLLSDNNQNTQTENSTSSRKSGAASDVQTSEKQLDTTAKGSPQDKRNSTSRSPLKSDSRHLDSIPETEPEDVTTEGKNASTEGKNASHYHDEYVHPSRANVTNIPLRASTSSLATKPQSLTILEDDQKAGTSNPLTSRSDSSITKKAKPGVGRSKTAKNQAVSMRSNFSSQNKSVLPPINVELKTVSNNTFGKSAKDSDDSIDRVVAANGLHSANVKSGNSSHAAAVPKSHDNTQKTESKESSELHKKTGLRESDIPLLKLDDIHEHATDEGYPDYEEEEDDDYYDHIRFEDYDHIRFTESQASTNEELDDEEVENTSVRSLHGYSAVRHMRAERDRRAKERSAILDQETVVKYSRRPRGPVTAMVGEPKRMEFLPPSKKLRHEHEKLIKTERSTEVQRQIEVEKFFEELFRPKDDEGRKFRKTTNDDESKKTKKPALSLAGALSTLFTAKNSGTVNNDPYERLKTCQYLRVYRPTPDENRSVERKLTSWDKAESSLRTGFMKFAFRE